MSIQPYFQYFVPLGLSDIFWDNTPTEDDFRVVNATKITFQLTPNYDLVPLFVDNRTKPWYTYKCQSCLYYCNIDFNTRLFDVSKDLPYEVEQEMYRHAKDHQIYGTWGIKVYREERKNIEAGRNFKKGK